MRFCHAIGPSSNHWIRAVRLEADHRMEARAVRLEAEHRMEARAARPEAEYPPGSEVTDYGLKAP